MLGTAAEMGAKRDGFGWDGSLPLLDSVALALDPGSSLSVINVTLYFKRCMINGPKIPGTPNAERKELWLGGGAKWTWRSEVWVLKVPQDCCGRTER